MQAQEPILLGLEERMTTDDSGQATLRFVNGGHAKIGRGVWVRWLVQRGVLVAEQFPLEVPFKRRPAGVRPFLHARPFASIRWEEHRMLCGGSSPGKEP